MTTYPHEVNHLFIHMHNIEGEVHMQTLLTEWR